MLRYRVEHVPDAEAFHVMSKDGTWRPVTWVAFNEQVNQFAASLAASGVVRSDRVAICARTSLEWEVAQMAAIRLGASVVGLEMTYSDELLASLIGQLHVVAFIAQDSATLARIPDAVLAPLKLVLTIEGANPKSSRARSGGDLQPAVAPELEMPLPPGLEDEVVVVFSSGTTGTPQPIAYCHGQLTLALDSILSAFPDIREGSRLVCWLPLANLFQRMINFAAMARGASTYFVSDPRSVMDHMKTTNPDVFIGVPLFFEKFRDGVNRTIETRSRVSGRIARWAIRIGCHQRRLSQAGRSLTLLDRLARSIADWLVLRKIRARFGASLRYILSGSAPMPYWLLEWFEGIGIPVLEAYGVSANITPIAANRHDSRKSGTAGRPLPGQDVSLGQDGEILVRGPGVAVCVDGAAPALFADWRQDRCLATGDLGEVDSEGFLRIIGRKGEIFKSSNGKWVAPTQIEGRLRALPYVEHAVALGAGRTSIVALLAVNRACLEALGAEAAQRTSTAANTQDMHRRVRQDVAKALDDLPSYQRPAALLMLAADTFSIAGGELTTNLKLRRARVEAKFAEAIDRSFAGSDRAPAPESAGFPAIIIDIGVHAS